MAAMEIRELRGDLSFGARISGVDREALADEGLREKLREVLKDRGLIIFEGMEPTAKMQVAVSKVFGPLKDHPTKSTPRDAETGDDEHGVIDMHYVPDTDLSDYKGGLVEIDGTIVTRFFALALRSLLQRRVELCRRAALAGPGARARPHGLHGRGRGLSPVPAELRDRIEGRNVIYTLDTRLTKARFGLNFKVVGDDPPITQALLKEVAIFPRAMHPAVWTRDNGDKALHVGCWMAVGIEHAEDAEGDKLLDDVSHTVNRLGQGSSAYWHEWSPTDMVIWDNTRMLHAVEGCDPKYERHTIRTTIQGDYGLGYFEDGKKIGEVFREVA